MEPNTSYEEQPNQKEHWWTVTLRNNEVYSEGYLSYPETNITIKRLHTFKTAMGLPSSVVINMSYLGYMTKEYFQS